MKSTRLKEMLEIIVESESTFNIQPLLGEVNTHLQKIADTPKESTHKTAFAETLGRLENAMIAMDATLLPTHKELFAEIGADKFFSTNIPVEIEQSVLSNSTMPTIARDYVTNLLLRRSAYLDEIYELRNNLKVLS